MALFGVPQLTPDQERARVVDEFLDGAGLTREAVREEAEGYLRRESEAEALFEAHGLGDLLRRDEVIES